MRWSLPGVKVGDVYLLSGDERNLSDEQVVHTYVDNLKFKPQVSMLPNTLTTNEVRDAAGAEVEFTRLSVSDRSTVFAAIGESLALPYRLSINHAETGAGLKRIRRSNIRFDLGSISTVDSVTPVTTSAYVVVSIPVGALAANTTVVKVLANLSSFLASQGSALLLDGTGNGQNALISGGL